MRHLAPAVNPTRRLAIGSLFLLRVVGSAAYALQEWLRNALIRRCFSPRYLYSSDGSARRRAHPLRTCTDTAPCARRLRLL